ncbi:unnamed protein product [Spodoptera littoralis]|uniref:Uncharacterized protein n=1 Tax=Spodoptera littoralis TaxID=7109 RepID=A0A9P0NBB4_SPOLI|nr:unnamed protein product [Spodoptera littoralis]
MSDKEEDAKENVDDAQDNIDEPQDNIDEPQDNIDEPQENFDEPQENLVDAEENVIETQENVVEVPENVVEVQENVVEVQENVDEVPENVDEAQENIEEDRQQFDEEVIGEIMEGGQEEEQEYQETDEEGEYEGEEDAESILTIYDPDDYISGAVSSPQSTIPPDIFEFEYSYGYNCHKFFNLCACDDMVVCFSSGSMITFLDVNTKQTWFRRSTTGGTVGSITSYRKDPNYRIVIAEDREGNQEPLIIMYTWPQMEMDAVLRDGTANGYAILDFSPDGELLASVGKEPDFNLTIWNWKRHKILLRTSAFTYGVHAVMFSPYCEGQLTTAGAAHIKFWKMAQTFTGLKLKGELGRFGKTEICDVLGVYPMPDEKVLSGCEWGNILVWEAGLVKLEVTQRGRKVCHNAPIIQFMLSAAGDEVTTIARDGCVRAWYWDTVDQADPPEDDPFVELNPVAETCVRTLSINTLFSFNASYSVLVHYRRGVIGRSEMKW